MKRIIKTAALVAILGAISASHMSWADSNQPAVTNDGIFGMLSPFCLYQKHIYQTGETTIKSDGQEYTCSMNGSWVKTNN